MASNSILADKGLVRGSFNVTIDGYTYRLKTAQRSQPVRSAFEYDENGKPVASSHVVDFQRLSGEILAYSGVPSPSQLKPFTYDGAYWSIGNLTLNYATEGLRSYNVEIVKLAGTAAADFTETA